MGIFEMLSKDDKEMLADQNQTQGRDTNYIIEHVGVNLFLD